MYILCIYICTRMQLYVYVYTSYVLCSSNRMHIDLHMTELCSTSYEQRTTMKSMQRTVPKFQYDVRTVLVHIISYHYKYHVHVYISIHIYEGDPVHCAQVPIPHVHCAGTCHNYIVSLHVYTYICIHVYTHEVDAVLCSQILVRMGTCKCRYLSLCVHLLCCLDTSIRN